MMRATGPQPATRERCTIEGPEGLIELQIDEPAGRLRGLALVGHPHPLYGGNLDNKVAATLARAFLALGWLAVRPNFRGVGASTGQHDQGVGETRDFCWLVDALPAWPRWQGRLPAGPALALAGFSFGSFVAAAAAQSLAQRAAPPPRAMVLVGAAVGKWPMPPVASQAIVIHGECDTTIPLADVLQWARPLDLPLIVMPGADHFFHRRLTLLQRLVVQGLLGLLAADADGVSSALGPADD